MAIRAFLVTASLLLAGVVGTASAQLVTLSENPTIDSSALSTELPGSARHAVIGEDLLGDEYDRPHSGGPTSTGGGGFPPGSGGDVPGDPVPEPTTIALFGLGLAAIGVQRHRRARR